MKRQCSIKSHLLIVPLLAAAMFLNSTYAAAEDPIPFHSMMQSAGSQAPVPSMQTTNSALQPVNTGHVTNAGKSMIVGGFVLFAVGVTTIAITAALNSDGFKPSDTKTPALYGVGAGAAAGGVTLITFGFHRRSAR